MLSLQYKPFLNLLTKSNSSKQINQLRFTRANFLQILNYLWEYYTLENISVINTIALINLS